VSFNCEDTQTTATTTTTTNNLRQRQRHSQSLTHAACGRCHSLVLMIICTLHVQKATCNMHINNKCIYAPMPHAPCPVCPNNSCATSARNIRILFILIELDWQATCYYCCCLKWHSLFLSHSLSLSLTPWIDRWLMMAMSRRRQTLTSPSVSNITVCNLSRGTPSLYFPYPYLALSTYPKQTHTHTHTHTCAPTVWLLGRN